MKKSLRKLIPAFVMMVVTMALLGTSTFAWFSMNNKVTVTGMEVSTRVSNSIFIAPSTTDATTKAADNTFKTNYVAHTANLLEPVSTINGVNFFYNSTNNVDSNGDAVTDSYVSYDPANTTAFNTNYNTTGAVGYVDYAFQLKATNTDPTNTYYVNLTKLELLYNGAATTEKAFRVAMFVNDMGADGATAATAPSESVLKTILKPTSAANFTATKAVKNTTTLDTVVNPDVAANIGNLTAGATRYYKVVIRLWLEGEDNTCNNTTFATLQSSWALNLEIELENATGGVAVLGKNNDANKADLSSAAVADPAVDVIVDGVTYHKLNTQLNGTDLYITEATLSSSSVVYTISGTPAHVTDVTNQCTFD
ncbi:MAG: hypothetical protein VZQ61_05775 [Christensenellaceae bacterium]